LAFSEWSAQDWVIFVAVLAAFLLMFRRVEAKQKSGEIPRPPRRTVVITGACVIALQALVAFSALARLSELDIAINLVVFFAATGWVVRQIATYGDSVPGGPPDPG
jgi:hypothetical protein